MRKERIGYLHVRVFEGYTYFSLDYDPRLAVHLFKRKIRMVLNRIKDVYRYDCTLHKEQGGWMTAPEVARKIIDDASWYVKYGIIVKP